MKENIDLLVGKKLNGRAGTFARTHFGLRKPTMKHILSFD